MEEVNKNVSDKKRPLETVNLYSSNGVVSFSVWEGGSITIRVSKRGENEEYITVWQGRINPVDFVSQFGELKTIAKTAQEELRKLLGTEI